MIVGVPKETKIAEKRVSLTPAGSEALVTRGNEVVVETGAGSGSGFSDEEYLQTGARIVTNGESVFRMADLVVKVKEPSLDELPFLGDGQMLFTYLHLAASEQLTRHLLDRRVVAIAYETIQLSDGSLPLLAPMSQIAGRMAPQEGAKYLEEIYGGRGILLSGTPGVPPAQVVVLGAGHVGFNAAFIAAGMGADVTILDLDPQKLGAIESYFRGRVTTLIADGPNLRTSLDHADLVIGAVLIPGARAPRLITRNALKHMKKGAVLVDVAIDQGGCAETSRPTTHADPIYMEEGIVHYCVSNMPGAVPRTATQSLTLNTLPYVLKIADKGWKSAAGEDKALRKGINLAEGRITCKAVADAFDLPSISINKLLADTHPHRS